MQIEIGDVIKSNIQSVIRHPEQCFTTIQVNKVTLSLGDKDADSLPLENVLITVLGDNNTEVSLSDKQKEAIDTFSK
jgi:hypothetical protein